MHVPQHRHPKVPIHNGSGRLRGGPVRTPEPGAAVVPD